MAAVSRNELAGKTVLVVEDDYKTASLISLYLNNEGARVVNAGDGETGLELALSLRPSLVVLDGMLPERDGLEVCEAIRERLSTPIIFLSARGQEHDRIAGLDFGADDYVTKPFSLKELAARANSLLRRSQLVMEEPDRQLQVGNVRIDRHSLRCFVDEHEIELTRSEFLLLEKLLSSPDRVFSRDSLIGALYPHGTPVVDRVVDVHIGKLRKKFADTTENAPQIQTVRGVGYRIAV